MDILDKIIQEWSVKTNKGYPDLNSKEDMDLFESMFGIRLGERINEEEGENEVSIETLKNLIDSNAGNKRLMQRVYRTLSSSTYISKLKDKLIQAGITKDLLDSRNLFDEIINILQKGKKSSIEALVSYQEKSEIPEKGNIPSLVPSIESEKLLNIGRLVGQSNSVTIGSGEVLLPILFSNVKLKRTGAGDFTIDGKTAELKSNLARLSGVRSGKSYTPYNDNIPSTWSKSLLGDVEAGKNNNNLEQVIENLNKFIADNYPNTTLRVSMDVIKNQNIVKFLGKVAIDDYIQSKGIDTYILFDKNNLNFRLFTPAEKLLDAIDKNEVSITTVPNPQLSGFSM